MWYNAECMNEAEKCIQGLKLEDNMKGRNHTKDLGVDGRMIIKWILKRRTGIKWSPVTGSCNWILYLTILLCEEWGIF